MFRSGVCPALFRHAFGSALMLCLLACGHAAEAQGTAAHLERTVVTNLNSPFGVAVDAKGNLAVADSFDNRVLLETVGSDGSFTQHVVAVESSPYNLQIPYGTAFDKNGNIFVADENSNRVLKETPSPSGGYTQTVVADGNAPYGLSNPNGVFVDSSGNVYIADSTNNRVLMETPSATGPYTQTVVADGSAAYGLNTPKAIAVDSSGNVYIADQANHRVLKETLLPSGSYVQSVVATSVQAPSSFNPSFYYDFPFGVAVDASGNVYYSTYNSNTSKAEVRRAVPSGGGYASSLVWTDVTTPYGMSISPSGLLYIALADMGTIVEVATSGISLGTQILGAASQTVSLTFKFDRSVFLGGVSVLTEGAQNRDFVDAGNSTCVPALTYGSGRNTCTVYIAFTAKAPGERRGAVRLNDYYGYPVATAYLNGVGVGPEAQFSPAAQSIVGIGFKLPGGVAVDGSGNVYVSDSGHSQVVRETPSSSGYSSNETLTLQSTAGVAVDGRGCLYVVDPTGGDVVSECDLLTVGNAQTTIDSELNSPYGVAVDTAGNVYVTTSTAVLKETLATDGSYTRSTVASGLGGPEGVAVDGDGNVYIADTRNGRLLKETRSSSGYSQSVIAPAVGSPWGVAVDGAGNVYVTDISQDRVLREARLSSGAYTETVVQTGLFQPHGVAVDSAGNLFIADTNDNQVLKEDVADPPSLTFATTAIGDTSTDSPKAVTVFNGGNSPLIFSVPSSGTNPAISSSSYVLSATSTCPQLTPNMAAASLDVGTSCTEALNFSPAQTGTLSGTLKFTDNTLNVTNSVQSVALSGTGILPTPTVNVPTTTVTYGLAGNLTAQISYTLATAPTGSVIFTIDGESNAGTGTCIVNAGIRTCRTSLKAAAYPPGTHTVYAQESADANYNPAQGTGSLVVNTPVATVTVSPQTIAYGTSSTTLTASVAYTGVSPQGGLTFSVDGGTAITATCSGSSSPLTCTATLSTASLAVGSHTVIATEAAAPSQYYQRATGTATLTVARPASATTLTLSSGSAAVSSVSPGTVVTLTASVRSGSSSVLRGLVKFCDSGSLCAGNHLLGVASLTSAGTAVLKIRPSLGSHSYVAAFQGNTAVAASKSSASALSVTGQTPVTVVTTSGSAGNYTLAAAVTGSGTQTAPAGNVSFVDTSNANYVLGTAKLVAGSPTQSFAAAVNYPTGRFPEQVVTGDFNGDGLPDLVVAVSSSLSILLGKGDGTFSSAVAIAGNAGGTLGYGAVAVGDFNGDGILDLVLTNPLARQFSVLLGNGDGTFGSGLSQTIGSYSVAIAVADLNGDGIPDLAFSNQDSTISVLLGKGDGTFGTPVKYTAGQLTSGIAAEDFNGDGFPDLVVTNESDNTVSVLLGKGDGTFSTQVSYATGSDPEAVAVGDFNGDGIADLAVENSGDSTVGILLGTGNGTFRAQSTYDSGGYYSITAADLDGDGVLDLALANPTPGTVTVLIGKGDGSFGAPVSYATGGGPTSVAIADFDGDGIEDLSATNNSDNTVSVLLNHVSATATATLTGVSPIGQNGTVHAVDASFPANSLYQSSVSPTVPLTVAPAATTLTLSATPSTSPYGSPVVLTATLTPFSVQGRTTDGDTVIFSSTADSRTVSVALKSGVATLTTGGLPVGTSQLSAKFSGDTNFLPSSSAALAVTVTRGNATVVINPPPATVYGAATISLSASITYSGSAAPSGAVSFSIDGGSAIKATCTGTSSPLTCSASYAGTLTGGVHTITAVLASDANYAAVTSAPSSFTVSPSTPVVTASVNPTSIIYGPGTVTLSAVAAYSGTTSPSPSITFTVDGASAPAATCPGAAPPNPGTPQSIACGVSFSVYELTAGVHTVVAALAADTNYNGASSPPVTFTVGKATPIVSASFNPSSISYGTSSVNLTASVAYSGKLAPTGSLQFAVDGSAGYTAACAGSSSPLQCTATYASALLSAGTHSLSASLAADGNYNAATSAVSTLDDHYLPPVCTLKVVSAPTPLTVTATAGCTDPQNLALTSMTLDWGDTTSNAAQTGANTHTYKAPGMYTVVLSATNKAGLSQSASQTIITYQLPTCTLDVITSNSASSAMVTASVTGSCVSSSGTPLPGGTIDWGDGSMKMPATNGQNVHMYPYALVPTTYTVTLSAVDPNGGTASATQKVIVVQQLAVAQGGGNALVSTTTDAQLPTIAPTLVTFVCSSVSYILNNRTVTNALPSDYRISCTSPTVTASPASTTQVSVTILTSSGNSTLVQNRSLEPRIFFCVLGFPLPFLMLGLSRGRSARLKTLSRAFAGSSLLLLCLAVSSCGGSFVTPTAVATPSGLYLITVTEKIVTSPTPPGFVQTSLIVPLKVGT